VTFTPGLIFINVLLTAFTRADPKRYKDTDDLTVFFMLLGSMSVKAANKMLVKLTLGVNCINFLEAAFLPVDLQL
jgi:hypothetical protein